MVVADLGTQYLAGAILAASAGLALVAMLLRIYVEIRRTPRELLQLRIFQRVDAVGRGLVALAVGIAGGVFLMLPIILQISLPSVLYVGAGIPFFVLFLYGLITIFMVFRFPKSPTP